MQKRQDRMRKLAIMLAVAAALFTACSTEAPAPPAATGAVSTTTITVAKPVTAPKHEREPQCGRASSIMRHAVDVWDLHKLSVARDIAERDSCWAVFEEWNRSIGEEYEFAGGECAAALHSLAVGVRQWDLHKLSVVRAQLASGTVTINGTEYHEGVCRAFF
jgi:hypothetical protein